MLKYHKINGLFKRYTEGEKKGKFTEEFSQPEFEYLFNNEWIGTEKIDGTSIRIHWNGSEVKIGGRTDEAQIPVFLYDKLNELIKGMDFVKIFFHDPRNEVVDVTLYGEGYGAKIQKGGGDYITDGVDFILFDVRIGKWWMKRDIVNDVAEGLNICSVPKIFEGTLSDAVKFVADGFDSVVGNRQAEGLVLTPKVDLLCRSGERIITKLKTKDFR